MPKDVLWRLLSIIVFLFIYHQDIKINAYNALLICALILIFVTIIQIWLSNLNNILSSDIHTITHKENDWYDLTKPIWFSAIIFSSTLQADVILIGLLIDAKIVASYFAALKIASVLALPILAINQLSGPMISKYYYAKNLPPLQNNLRLYLVMCTSVIIPMILIIIFYGKNLLSLFNPDFVDAYPILIALSIGYLFHSLSGPASMFLQMTGRSKLALKTSLATQITAIIALPFSAILYSSLGVAIIKMLEMCTRNILQSFHVYRLFGIHTSITSIYNKNDLALKKIFFKE